MTNSAFQVNRIEKQFISDSSFQESLQEVKVHCSTSVYSDDKK